MAKDFFDEELDKIEQEEASQKALEEQRQRQIENWYGAGGSNNDGNQSMMTTKRPLYIALICVALVLAIALGWVLCALFGASGSFSEKEQIRYAQTVVNNLREQGIEISDEQLQIALSQGNSMVESGQIKQEALLSVVFDYLHNNYYKEISEEKWTAAVATAGTALLQAAGDQFCQLMSPQSYYDYINQTSNVGDASGGQGYFGIKYQYSEGLGLYVSDVQSDSSCYGKILSGDIVLKMTNVKDRNGNAVNILGLGELNEVVIADYDSVTLTTIMASIYSANFRILRNGDVLDTGVIVRGAYGFESGYDYQFIEFYFDRTHSNISTTNQNNAAANTYDMRGLSRLPSDTGYIRIVEFMYYTDGMSTVTAATEFAEVMELFKQLGLKRLVLDLKGNPGGLVNAVCDIAGMLATDAKLTSAQQNVVRNNDKLLITSLIPREQNKTTREYRKSSYSDFFGAPSDICDIVVWTDGGSASASELLTGALSDYGTGFQIGTKTYGKGIAQTVEQLKYKGQIVTETGEVTQGPWAIYYTFAAYYSPLGTNIHGKGYTPQDGYNGITDYVSQNGSETLWDATYRYWGISK